MDRIKIQPDAINSMRSTLVSNSSNLSEVNRTVSALLNNIDSKIQNRRNIHSRLAAAKSSASQLNEKLKSIEQVINQSVNKYNGVENYLVGRASSVGKVNDSRFLELQRLFDGLMAQPSDKDVDRYFGFLENLYELYDKYGTVSGMMAVIAMQAKYYGLGLTKFIELADGTFEFRHMDEMARFGKYLDESKYGKPISKFLINPWYSLPYYKKYNLTELIHKNFTQFYPQNLVDFSNLSRRAMGLTDEIAEKVSWKAVFKTGEKFARGNFVTTLLVTGAVETVGLGLNISKNYSKYGDNPEKLKEENAKAVGNAVNKTVWVTAGATVGTLVGGALGSVVGPVGTAIGGVVGSAVGGLVGEQVAKLTSGVAENFALNFKDPIQSGIEKGKEVFETASKGVNTIVNGINSAKEGISKGIDNVKDTASSLLKNAKKAFDFDLSFG